MKTLSLIILLLLGNVLYANPDTVCLIRTEPILEKGSSGVGSGFFVKQNEVITAFHVVREALEQNRRIRVEYQNRIYRASLLRWCRESDIALLKVNSGDNVTLAIIAENEPEKNHILVNYGHAGGRWQIHSSKGPVFEFLNRLAVINRNGPVARFYTTKSVVHGGMSGGPVVNSDGHVVGLVSHKSTDNNNPLTYIASLPELKRILNHNQ